MAKTTTEGFRFSLGTRFFLATVAIAVVAVGAAVAVTSVLGTRIARGAVSRVLERSGTLQETFQERNLNYLRLVARLFADSPPFAAYVAEAIANNDPLSLNDQLEERKADLGYDLAIVLDPAGRVFARTDEVSSGRDDLSGEPLVLEALNSDYGEAYGTWVSRGRLYYAAAVPIGAGGLLQGFLIAGAAIDADAALELRTIGDGEVTFVVHAPEGPTFAVTTLEQRLADALRQQLRERPQLLDAALYGEPRELELGGRRFLALVHPLAGATDETVGSVVSLASLDEQLAPYRRIQRTLLAVGLGAVLVAVVLALFLKRRVSHPLTRLADAAQKAAAGDYDQHIVAAGGDEVGRLAEAFDTLLSDLREKRDMEAYITELARNVPDEEGAAAAVEDMVPAEGREMALVGVELRGYSERLAQAATPREALDRLAAGIRFVVQTIAGFGGKVQAVAGHRVVAGFAGPRHTERALAAAAAVLAGAETLRRASTVTAFGTAAPAADGVSTAVALASGPLVSGSVVWESRPEHAVAGRPVDELENLLRVARAGSLWFSRFARDELREVLAASGAEPKEHRNPITQEPIFALAGETAARLVSHGELTATRDLTAVTSTASPMTTLSSVGPGSQLGDRFKIISQLGAGGMGVVYKAKDYSLDELVALKMLKAEVWNDPQRLGRLKEELKLARKIAHPNVLRTYDFGELGGVPFISMEYVRGITLRRLLDQSGRLPLSAGLRLARQLCRGLAAAHAQKVLHRDIKPENLIVEHVGNVKLMDFGIAQRLERRATPSEPGQIVGTPYYLAPEQLQGREADERSDLYATGVVLYELFTGKLPYPVTGNVMQIISVKMKEAPTPPRQHWETMPEELERIILRCMARQPDERYPDAEALLRELEGLRA